MEVVYYMRHGGQWDGCVKMVRDRHVSVSMWAAQGVVPLGSDVKLLVRPFVSPEVFARLLHLEGRCDDPLIFLFEHADHSAIWAWSRSAG